MASVNAPVDEFLRIGCGCQNGPNGRQCIENFSKEEFVSCRDSFLELSKDEKDLFILSFLTLTRKRGANERHSSFTIYGEKTCKTTFLYLLNMSKHKFQNIAEHYQSDGLTSRVHGNKGRLPHNTFPFDCKKHIKDFILSYAEDHALPLPGRIPGYRDESILLISSAESKKNVWEFYRKSCEASSLKDVGYSLFVELWQTLVPWVVIAKPSTDLCWTCQNNNQLILQQANIDDVSKVALLQKQLDHLNEAKKEREYYKLQCHQAEEEFRSKHPTFNPFDKAEPCSFKGIAHYSWDYAQQVHYPTNPQQPGPIYFKTPRKCSIFGICNDAMNYQFNYLVDEIVSTGKGANTTISYLHHFFEHHGMGETSALLHADNCIGELKTNIHL